MIFMTSVGEQDITIKYDHEGVGRALQLVFSEKKEKTKNPVATIELCTALESFEERSRQCLQGKEINMLPGEFSYEHLDDGTIYYGNQYGSFVLGNKMYSCLVNWQEWDSGKLTYNNLFYLVIRPLLFECLWQLGLFYLHSACVRHREHGTLLIVGERNHGKSTISYSLLDSGHALLSDDNVFWCIDGETLRMYTIPRELHLPVDLGTKVSSLKGIEKRRPYAEEIKKKVSVYRHELPESLIIDSCDTPKAIVFPKVCGGPSTLGGEIYPAEATQLLLCNSYPGMYDPKWTQSITFLSGLRRMITGAKSITALALGIDTYDDPGRCVDIIEELAFR
ncbi:MAG: hypothetical protein F4W92_10895 [Gammaproteobacteria bacterium]|nr:hypothetical protein [Gammaproteobacteria bacterium]